MAIVRILKVAEESAKSSTGFFTATTPAPIYLPRRVVLDLADPEIPAKTKPLNLSLIPTPPTNNFPLVRRVVLDGSDAPIVATFKYYPAGFYPVSAQAIDTTYVPRRVILDGSDSEISAKYRYYPAALYPVPVIDKTYLKRYIVLDNSDPEVPAKYRKLDAEFLPASPPIVVTDHLLLILGVGH